MKLKEVAFVGMMFAVSGCTIGAKSDPVDLKAALISTGDAIRAADAAAKEKGDTGLIASEVVVAFQVVTSKKDSGHVDLQVVPIEGVSIGGGWAGEVVKTKGNTITVKYQNLLFAPGDTVGGKLISEGKRKPPRDGSLLFY